MIGLVVLGMVASANYVWRPITGISGDTSVIEAVPEGPRAPAGTEPSSSDQSRALDPANFATGACTALESTANVRNRTVFLDVGHGGPDPGAAATLGNGKRITEKDTALVVALAAATSLRSRGYRVVLSRTADSTVARLADSDVKQGSLTVQGAHADGLARIRCANLAKADVLVSINFNSFTDADVGGATTVYEPERPFAARSADLAALLQREVLATLAGRGWSIADRGVAADDVLGSPSLTPEGDSYGHLSLLGPTSGSYIPEATTMPGAVLEPLFLSNPDESAVAADPRGQQAIAEGITVAIDTFLSA